MPRINGIGVQVAGGNAGLCINPVDRAGYPRINCDGQEASFTH
jgi:hypothetical protein